MDLNVIFLTPGHFHIEQFIVTVFTWKRCNKKSEKRVAPVHYWVCMVCESYLDLEGAAVVNKLHVAEAENVHFKN